MGGEGEKKREGCLIETFRFREKLEVLAKADLRQQLLVPVMLPACHLLLNTKDASSLETENAPCLLHTIKSLSNLSFYLTLFEGFYLAPN